MQQKTAHVSRHERARTHGHNPIHLALSNHHHHHATCTHLGLPGRHGAVEAGAEVEGLVVARARARHEVVELERHRAHVAHHLGEEVLGVVERGVRVLDLVLDQLDLLADLLGRKWRAAVESSQFELSDANGENGMNAAAGTQA